MSQLGDERQHLSNAELAGWLEATPVRMKRRTMNPNTHVFNRRK